MVFNPKNCESKAITISSHEPEPSASVCQSTAASQQSDAEWIDDVQSLISGCVISHFVAAGAGHATWERPFAVVLRLRGQKDPRSLFMGY